jgi:apolipoprotein D and lipocalin family protein
MRSWIVAVALAATVAACASPQPSYRSRSVEIKTVESVDLQRYAGLWYEIARYPNRFEEGCVGVTAEYQVRNARTIDVVNTCHRPGEPTEVAEGVGKVVARSGARLRVTFAPTWIPFAWGDYWILALDEGYQTALVGSPDGKYLWVLARQPAIEASRWNAMLAAAATNGYDPSKLVRTPPPPPS